MSAIAPLLSAVVNMAFGTTCLPCDLHRDSVSAAERIKDYDPDAVGMEIKMHKNLRVQGIILFFPERVVEKSNACNRRF